MMRYPEFSELAGFGIPGLRRIAYVLHTRAGRGCATLTLSSLEKGKEYYVIRSRVACTN